MVVFTAGFQAKAFLIISQDANKVACRQVGQALFNRKRLHQCLYSIDIIRAANKYIRGTRIIRTCDMLN